MRFLIYFLLVFVVILGCKKSKYDPNEYDSLVYKYVPDAPPPKEYIFKAEVDSVYWNTTGSAIVVGDTLIVTGTFGTQTLLIKISGYKTQNTFEIGHRKDSSALYPTINTSYDYASIVGSGGSVSLIKLDTKYNQIEASFNLTLFDNAGDSIQITNGYFKINFTPNSVQWIENTKFIHTADSIWVNSEDPSQYVVYAMDTNRPRRTLVLYVLKNPTPNGFGFNYGIGQGGSGGMKADYDTLGPKSPLFFHAKSSTGVSGGYLNIISNSDNVVKGQFSDLTFSYFDSTVMRNRNKLLKNGSFSAKFQ